MDGETAIFNENNTLQEKIVAVEKITRRSKTEWLLQRLINNTTE